MKLLFTKAVISFGICSEVDTSNILSEEISASARPNEALLYINDMPMHEIDKSNCCVFDHPQMAQGMLIQRHNTTLRVCGLNLTCEEGDLNNKSFVDYLYDEFIANKSAYKTSTIIYNQPIVGAQELMYVNTLISSLPKIQNFKNKFLGDDMQLTAPVITFHHVYVTGYQHRGVIIRAPKTCMSVIEYVYFKRLIPKKPMYFNGIIDFDNNDFGSIDGVGSSGVEVINASISIKFRSPEES